MRGNQLTRIALNDLFGRHIADLIVSERRVHSVNLGPSNARIGVEVRRALDIAVLVDEVVEEYVQLSFPLCLSEERDVGFDCLLVVIRDLGNRCRASCAWRINMRRIQGSATTESYEPRMPLVGTMLSSRTAFRMDDLPAPVAIDVSMVVAGLEHWHMHTTANRNHGSRRTLRLETKPD